VSELPPNWTTARLSDICETTSGGTPSRSRAAYFGGSIPWLKSGELNDGLVTEIEETITEAGLRDSNAKVFPKGTVLIALYGATVGRLGILGLSASTNQAVCGVFPADALDHGFLFYHLLSLRDQLVAASFGGAQRNISQRIVRDLTIPVAPLAEQRRIVAEIEKQFTRLDAAVAALRSAKARMKTFRSSVLAACFLESAWPMVSLGVLIERIEAGNNFKCEERPPQPDEIGVAKVSAVTWGRYNELASKTCNDKSRRKDQYLIRPGDFLFSRANTLELVGACVIVNAVTLQIMLSDKVLRVVLRDVEPRWVLHALRSRLGRQQIEALATGNQLSMRNISQQSLSRVEIPLPPPEQQIKLIERIEVALSFADNIARTIEINRTRADRLRQSILKRAFEGKLVPQLPADEPASALLARISGELPQDTKPAVGKRFTRK
jgi:type I restriction enzyme S subunit